jgi:pimeloyl-ACP methyl ester carboxylesterase
VINERTGIETSHSAGNGRIAVVWRPLLIGLLVASTVYFGAAAAIIRFGLDGLLFPRTRGFAGPTAERVEHIVAEDGAEILARLYGSADRGCVVFFPGQHGYLPAYDLSNLTRAGLRVWLLSYPGQNGASGRATVEKVEALAGRAIRMAVDQCPQGKVVLVGVSLGATLAVRAAAGVQPVGTVLVSASPALSDAIRRHLAARWYWYPLQLLPISRVLKRDFKLSASLPVHTVVTIFQGSADDQTPLAALRDDPGTASRAEIVRVEGGTHSTTFALSEEDQRSTILRMLASTQPNEY